jgi:hypothetical protein
LWKNGAAQPFTHEAEGSVELRSVFVSGSDVYVAGTEYNATSTATVARLWKNGVLQALPQEATFSEACSIFVSAGDVYVAGYEWVFSNDNLVNNARLWKNGAVQTLEQTGYSSAASVYVLGSDVYVAGATGGNLVVWKNGAVEQTLPSSDNGGSVTSIFVK